MIETEGSETGNRDGLLSEGRALDDERRAFSLRPTPAWKSYLSSRDGVELAFSLSVSILAILMKIIDVDPRQRPIPYIQLESTGEYVVNQVYNEEFENNTVSSTYASEMILFPRICTLTIFSLKASSCICTALSFHWHCNCKFSLVDISLDHLVHSG